MYMWPWNLAPEGRTRQGKHNRMCIQGSLWQDVCRKNWRKVHEYKTVVGSKTKRDFTRSQRTASLTEYSKSALTGHANQANHTIDWKNTTVIDREQHRPTRWIKAAVRIRKESHRAMNRDEGSYHLSHAYDCLLDATADRRIKTRKNWVPASSDKDLVIRSKRQNKVLKFWLWYMNFLLELCYFVVQTAWSSLQTLSHNTLASQTTDIQPVMTNWNA